ncbi:MAG: hypothetical protein ABIH41_03030 [Nanoarchaeota archaeon]
MGYPIALARRCKALAQTSSTIPSFVLIADPAGTMEHQGVMHRIEPQCQAYRRQILVPTLAELNKAMPEEYHAAIKLLDVRGY